MVRMALALSTCLNPYPGIVSVSLRKAPRLYYRRSPEVATTLDISGKKDGYLSRQSFSISVVPLKLYLSYSVKNSWAEVGIYVHRV